MKSGRQLRLIGSVLAATMALAGVPPRAPAQPQIAPASLPSTRQATPLDAAAIASRDLQQLAATLNDPRAALEQREEAARRLVSRRSPLARQILADTLVNLNMNGQLAVTVAVADDPDPDPALVDKLFAVLLENRSRQLTEKAARALANYKDQPDVLNRLIRSLQRHPPYAEPIRREIIRALGSLVEKDTAAALVAVLRSPDESATIHNAAAEALSDLTGIDDFGQSPQEWSDWWSRMANKSDVEFRNELLPRRAARYDQMHRRYQDLIAEVQASYDARYQSASPSQRPDILVSYLRNPSPEIRAVGANIVLEDVQNSKAVTLPVREQLRTMIGDSDPAVRTAVARALAGINDADALEPLLAQLSQETDGQVRGALAEAIGVIPNLRSVPALIKLLNDPSTAAATKAAKSLELLGPKINQDNPALARTTAEALRDALDRHPPDPGNVGLREALVEAMAPLKQESLLQRTLYPLLRERNNESPEMRRLALRAIGEIGNPQSADTIVQSFQDPDSHVRLAAVNALDNLPNAADFAEPLRQRLDPREEPSVREAAWKALQSVLPNLTIDQLNSFADRFKENPPRQLFVLKILENALNRAKREEDLAAVRENIGALLLNLSPDDPKSAAEAATYFKLALDYRKSQPQSPEVVIARLRDDRMRALLASRQYDAALDFAANSIKESPATRPTMGAAIEREVERLQASQSPDDLNTALQLIANALKLAPPLADVHKEALADAERAIRKRISEKNGGPPGGANFLPRQNAGAAAPDVVNTLYKH